MIESMSGPTAVLALCFLGICFLAAAVAYILLSTEVDAMSDEHDRLDALAGLPEKRVSGTNQQTNGDYMRMSYPPKGQR